jgi:hypothetical protein
VTWGHPRRRDNLLHKPAVADDDRLAGEGVGEIVKLLDATLGEEKKTNDALTELAESEVNQHAQAA